jgi:hypothetical protein
MLDFVGCSFTDMDVVLFSDVAPDNAFFCPLFFFADQVPEGEDQAEAPGQAVHTRVSRRIQWRNIWSQEEPRTFRQALAVVVVTCRSLCILRRCPRILQ